jgi:hypothetical protein
LKGLGLSLKTAASAIKTWLEQELARVSAKSALGHALRQESIRKRSSA